MPLELVQPEAQEEMEPEMALSAEHISVTEDLEQDKKTVKRVEQEAALEDLARDLTTKFQKFVDDKQPIVMRMLQDYSQYQGQYFQEEDLGFNEILRDPKKLNKVSRVFVNITRSRTDGAEARMSDMLFPNDDRNWDIEPTPVPDMPEALKNSKPLQLDTGQPIMTTEQTGEGEKTRPMTEADLADAQMKDAMDRCKKMRLEIDDQLVEAGYPVQARNAVRHGVQLGTGILKGPMQVGRMRRAWVPKMSDDNEVVHVLEIKEEIRPDVYAVSPWNFFPDMTSGNNVKDACATFEVHYKTPAQMKEYLRTPGFIEPQIRKVLEDGPEGSQLLRGTSHVEWIRRLAGINSLGWNDDRYQILEYHGPICKKILTRLGVDIDEDDPLEMQEGFVWFAGDTIIKLALHHLDSKDKLYSIFNWEKDEASIFGYGVPYTMRAPQKVINASWRMVLDNAGLSTGPQIVINQGIMEPADGDWTMTPRKIWYLLDEDADVGKAFKTFNIESHQQELIQIFNEAKKLVEEETNLSNVSQGMQGTSGRTFSGLSMLMNASNIMLRRAVKYFDDDVTAPIITRMYDWNMQFNSKPSIKGDFSVKALGSSSLLVKELQSQGLLALMQYINDPTIGWRLKVNDILRALSKSLHVDPRISVKDDATIDKEEDDRRKQAQEQSPVSPDIMAKIESQERIALSQAQTKAQQMELELALADKRTEELLATLASKENTTVEKIMADYDIAKFNAEWDAQKFYDELQVKQLHGTGI